MVNTGKIDLQQNLWFPSGSTGFCLICYLPQLAMHISLKHLHPGCVVFSFSDHGRFKSISISSCNQSSARMLTRRRIYPVPVCTSAAMAEMMGIPLAHLQLIYSEITGRSFCQFRYAGRLYYFHLYIVPIFKFVFIPPGLANVDL